MCAVVTVVPSVTTPPASGVIGGPQGAVARLGLRRTTLLYRMEKLGVSRQPP
jgi:hypothetical protein